MCVCVCMCVSACICEESVLQKPWGVCRGSRAIVVFVFARNPGMQTQGDRKRGSRDTKTCSCYPSVFGGEETGLCCVYTVLVFMTWSAVSGDCVFLFYLMENLYSHSKYKGRNGAEHTLQSLHASISMLVPLRPLLPPFCLH